MEIILRADVAKVGKRGDIVNVADGFGRNYLVAKGLALRSSPGARAQAGAMRRGRDLRDARDREAAEQVARTLVPLVIRIPARTGTGGRLFGSVTNSDLVAAVEAQTGIALDRRKVHLDEPLKTIGTHDVPVKLHADVEFRVTVEVVPAG